MNGWLVLILLTAPPILAAVVIVHLAERDLRRQRERFERSLRYLEERNR